MEPKSLYTCEIIRPSRSGGTNPKYNRNRVVYAQTGVHHRNEHENLVHKRILTEVQLVKTVELSGDQRAAAGRAAGPLPRFATWTKTRHQVYLCIGTTTYLTIRVQIRTIISHKFPLDATVTRETDGTCRPI